MKIELVNDYKVRFLMPHGKDSSALLACPFCGGKPKISEMRYINTGRLYGYWLKCAGCGLEIKEQPGCWPAGKENESMLEAKSALENRWNTRAAPEADVERKETNE